MTRDGLRQVRTDRLDLRALTLDDVDALYLLNADPEGWRHFPQRRHTSRERTLTDVEQAVAAWDRDGLAYWAARVHGSPDLAGFGGVRPLPDVAVWNVGFRFAAQFQGLGLARELAQAGLDAYYDPQAPEQTDRFIEEFFAAARRLRDFPLSAPAVRNEARRVSLRVFPYQLWYRVRDKAKVVEIIAVLHHCQDSARLDERLHDEG